MTHGSTQVKPFIMGGGNEEDFDARRIGDRARIGTAIEQGLDRRAGSSTLQTGSHRNCDTPRRWKHKHRIT